MLLIQDKRVRTAVSPEERMGADGTLSTIVSVTDVRLSGDLQVAKIYLSFFGADGRGEDIAFQGLQKIEGYMRSQVGKAMGLQRVPEIRFMRDESLAQATKVLSLLDGLKEGEAFLDENGQALGQGGDEDDDGIILVQ